MARGGEGAVHLLPFPPHPSLPHPSVSKEVGAAHPVPPQLCSHSQSQPWGPGSPGGLSQQDQSWLSYKPQPPGGLTSPRCLFKKSPEVAACSLLLAQLYSPSGGGGEGGAPGTSQSRKVRVTPQSPPPPGTGPGGQAQPGGRSLGGLQGGVLTVIGLSQSLSPTLWESFGL